MPLPDGLAARFKVHYRCLNCERNITKTLDVPDVEDAPRGVDELLESAFFQNQRYFCDGCESFIGTLIGVSQWRPEEQCV
ncbi:hypothetical protein [Bosea lathyri]|uniref:Uncharacterized protein n=1 Tax=Bosea lathyri TaxID=1036778 RepID=A0A1H6BE34_9HYPH|nr:hypothetical protein [Bosea lathyri]SEG58920.1 hypothetical protein SAMN04488115_107163 [Bosea lathyri]